MPAYETMERTDGSNGNSTDIFSDTNHIKLFRIFHCNKLKKKKTHSHTHTYTHTHAHKQKTKKKFSKFLQDLTLKSEADASLSFSISSTHTHTIYIYMNPQHLPDDQKIAKPKVSDFSFYFHFNLSGSIYDPKICFVFELLHLILLAVVFYFLK